MRKGTLWHNCPDLCDLTHIGQRLRVSVGLFARRLLSHINLLLEMWLLGMRVISNNAGLVKIKTIIIIIHVSNSLKKLRFLIISQKNDYPSRYLATVLYVWPNWKVATSEAISSGNFDRILLIFSLPNRIRRALSGKIRVIFRLRELREGDSTGDSRDSIASELPN